MPINRLLTAAAASALVAAFATTAAAQTPATAKTEAAAQAATGKATTDAPAQTAVQGTAKAVKEGAAPAAVGAAANVQATTPAAADASAAKQVAVQGDLVDTLKLNGQFTTFVKGIDSTNLTQLLKTNKNLTVFAPTDAAFAAMPAADLARLQSDKTAMQKFILHHIINAPVDTTKIKGARGPVPSGAGDNVLLDGSDEAGVLKADGATIVQADLKTGSGLLHVVDKPLIAGAGGTAEASTAAAPAETGSGSDASTAAAKPKS